MSNLTSRVAAALIKVPILGQGVRILGALIQLPDIRDRQKLFEEQQLPRLLDAVAELNARQLEFDNRERELTNLTLSAPASFRNLARQIASLEATVNTSLDDRLSVNDRLKNMGDYSAYLSNRVEFVRRELMFEMRYGSARGEGNDTGLTVQPRVIAEEKLTKAKAGTLRLNLGCGHIAMESYINVDRRDLDGVDLVAEVDNLPFEANELDEIFSAHLLEHFPQEQLRREILPYYFSLLKEGGSLHAVVPDTEAMMAAYKAGDMTYGELREVTFGAQDYDGDFHYNMFTVDSLIDLLTEAGFESAEVIAAGRVNGACRELELKAVKPISSS